MGWTDNLNPDLASRLDALFKASGGQIGPGSGYRTVDEQIQLRKTNGCPDVWKSPASSCRIATAIPGRSKHNEGNAMDLTGPDGRTLRRDRHPEAFAWLQANLANFGLGLTVPDEDWHVEVVDGAAGGSGAGQSGQGPVGFDVKWMDEPGNPEDELAERLHAVMRTLGSGVEPIDSPEDMVDPNQIGQDITSVPSDKEFTRQVQVPGASPTGGGGGSAGGDAASYQAFARQKLAEFGWGEDQMPALIELWNRESNWNPNADNPTSTAYGIAQFLDGTWKGTGFERTSDPAQQILAGLTYIKGRYGDPNKALSFWNQKHWY